MDEKLVYFTPMSKIESNKETDLDLIIKMLEKEKSIKQTDNIKEYDYIKDKSIKFFNNYDAKII